MKNSIKLIYIFRNIIFFHKKSEHKRLFHFIFTFLFIFNYSSVSSSSSASGSSTFASPPPIP